MGSEAVQATSVLALSVVFTVQPVVSIRVSKGESIKIIVSDLGCFPCQFVQIILKTLIGIGREFKISTADLKKLHRRPSDCAQ